MEAEEHTRWAVCAGVTLILLLRICKQEAPEEVLRAFWEVSMNHLDEAHFCWCLPQWDSGASFCRMAMWSGQDVAGDALPYRQVLLHYSILALAWQECPLEATVNIPAMAAWTVLVGRLARGFSLAFLGSVASGAEKPLRVAAQQCFRAATAGAESGVQALASATECEADIFMDSVDWDTLEVVEDAESPKIFCSMLILISVYGSVKGSVFVADMSAGNRA